MPLTVILDGHIFDDFEKDASAAALLNALACESKVVVLMPHVLREELSARVVSKYRIDAAYAA